MKILDLSQKMLDFSGDPIPRGVDNKEDTLLKHVLLTYIRGSNNMGIKEHERTIVYELGSKISNGNKKIEFTQGEYDAIKRLTDNGMVDAGQGAPQYIFPLEMSEQAKKMVNEAETVKDSKK